jgi:hypothetical protein
MMMTMAMACSGDVNTFEPECWDMHVLRGSYLVTDLTRLKEVLPLGFHPSLALRQAVSCLMCFHASLALRQACAYFSVPKGPTPPPKPPRKAPLATRPTLLGRSLL